MASSAQKLAHNLGAKGIKCAFVRLGDDGESTSTTDAYLLSGTGVPSGAYNLPTGATALYMRENAAGSGSCLYVTADAGTAWTALTNATFDPQDDETLAFGTGNDIVIAWDGTRLNVTQATVNSEIRWGVDGAGIDQRWYGDTASTFMLWDQSRDTLVLADNARVGYGSGAGAAADIETYWNGTKLIFAQLTANSAIDFGADGAGIDLVLYGDTAGEKATWDQSADAFVLTALVSITGQGSTVVPLIPIAAPQALTGAGAINITTYRTNWTTTAADAGTLANGAQIGQLKRIQMIVDGGDGTLTPTSLSGGTTITFADAGDYAVLCWNGTAWVAIELGNDADGVTAPVLA